MKLLRKYGAAAFVMLVAVVLVSKGRDLGAVAAIIETAQWRWVVLSALVPLTLCIGFSSARLRAILKAVEPTASVPFVELMRMSVVAFAINHLSMAPAGQAIRCIRLADYGVTVAAGVFSQMLEKLIEVLALGILAATMLMIWEIPSGIKPSIQLFIGVAALLSLTVRLVPRFRPARSAFEGRIEQGRGSVFHQIANFLDSSGRAKLYQAWVVPLCWSMLSEISHALGVAASLYAVGISVSPGLCFCTLLGAKAATLIPSLGRVGTQEIGMMLGLTAFGVPNDLALAAALLYHACNLLPLTVAAVIITFFFKYDSINPASKSVPAPLAPQ